MEKKILNVNAPSVEKNEVTVNGFVIIQNQPGGFYDKSKDYLVFHPIYDGFYMLKDFDTLDEAKDWAAGENFDEWTQKLI